MGAPEILYWITWQLPGKPQRMRALANHAASMQLAAVLEPLGADVRRVPAERGVTPPAGDERPSDDDTGGHRHFREPDHIGYRYPVDPGRVSSGNGTEFS